MKFVVRNGDAPPWVEERYSFDQLAGTAKEQVGYDALPPALSADSKKKYGWPYDPRMGGVIFKVTPRMVFALPEKQFATAPTRWIFK